MLENQNENIHSKLKELLESNKEVRKEMANLCSIEKRDQEPSSSVTNMPEISQLQQMHSLSLNNNTEKILNNSKNNSTKK